MARWDVGFPSVSHKDAHASSTLALATMEAPPMIFKIVGLVIGLAMIGVLIWSFVVFVQILNIAISHFEGHDRDTCNCSTCLRGKNNGQGPSAGGTQKESKP